MWARDRKTVGLSPKVWARDLRASGITEARAAGVSTDDAAKVAGHSSTKTTRAVYDRAVLAAAERFAKARVLARARKTDQEEHKKS
jgi:integrase